MLMTISKDFAPVNYVVWRPLLRPIDPLLEMFPQEADRGSSYDLAETEECYVISLDVPGVEREDLSVESVNGRIQVSGVRHGNRNSRRFQYAFQLPAGVQPDNISADLRDGVLHLSIPKPASAKPTKIKIGTDSSKTGFLKNVLGDKLGKDFVETNKVPVTVAT